MPPGSNPGLNPPHAPCVRRFHVFFSGGLGDRPLVPLDLEQLAQTTPQRAVAQELAERKAKGLGLATPEHAVLLAYSKMWLSDELVASDLPEDPWVATALQRSGGWWAVGMAAAAGVILAPVFPVTPMAGIPVALTAPAGSRAGYRRARRALAALSEGIGG